MAVSASLPRSFFIAGAILLMAGPVKADVLQGLGSALSSTLNQSVQNTQNGVQNGVQNTIQSNIAHPNEVNAANTATLNPKTLCSQIPAELQSKYTRVCASFDANNPCSALPASGLVSKEQGKLQSLCNARQSLTALQGQATNRATAQVTPSSQAVGQTVSQQLQNQINAFATRH